MPPTQTVYSQCPNSACIWGDDGYGNYPFNNTQTCVSNGGCEVVSKPGSPIGDCTTGSAQVGQTLGFVNGVSRSVVDINAIFQADGIAYAAPGGGLTVHTHIWGWVYKDDAGQYWMQVDPQFQWTASFAAGVNAYAGSLGISLNAPTGTSPQGPLGAIPQLPSGQRYDRCYTKGNRWG